MKVIDLLNKIANGEEVPKYVSYYNMKKENSYIMYVCKENIIYKLDNLEVQLNSRVVEMKDLEDNDDLELLPEDKLQQIEGLDKKKHNIALDWNFRVLKDKINELVEEINEIRKEMK